MQKSAWFCLFQYTRDRQRKMIGNLIPCAEAGSLAVWICVLCYGTFGCGICILDMIRLAYPSYNVYSSLATPHIYDRVMSSIS